MQRSGQSAPAVVDHRDLADILQREGPFLTVWAARPDPLPNAISSRLRGMHGADAAVIPTEVFDALADAVAGQLPAAEGVVAVADRSGVVLTEALPEPPRHELERVGAVPSLSPVIEHRQASIPFVVLVADRRGCDLYWSGRQGEGATSVAGDDMYIRKVQAGGWSHRTFQQRAENTWDHTAGEIAAELTRVVDEVRARVVTVSGDVRMLQLLQKRLPSAVASRVREVPGGRSDDGSDDAHDAAVRRWIRTAVAEDTVAVLRQFDEERGRADRAADGAVATFAALREARVDTLLVHDDVDVPGTGFFAPGEAMLVAENPDILAAMGRSDLRQARAVDVAIRASVLTGAAVRVVPASPRLTDGLGALLRW
ncbi:MAG: Vms1/Ankzf1 family peptidyl-tRNA hydrolase [Ilumatobacteraceae bacterium]